MCLLDGGYPFIVGGSPKDKPTSRPAIAQRVTVSVIKNTFLPLSLKYSQTEINAIQSYCKRNAGSVYQYISTDYSSSPKSKHKTRETVHVTLQPNVLKFMGILIGTLMKVMLM